MMSLRRLLTRMKRFTKRLTVVFKVLVASLMVVYLCYVSIVLFSTVTSVPDSSFNLKNDRGIVNVAKRSLFLVPKRNVTQSSRSCEVTVAIILCEDDRYLGVRNRSANSSISSTRPPIAKDFSRQLNQTIVLLKSIAVLTKFGEMSKIPPCIEVLILSDKEEHSSVIQANIKASWSKSFQDAIKLRHLPVRYPPESAWMKKLFRPCATLRLFLAELLPPEVDSVIYLDTDIIFFQSVQKLWTEFQRFDQQTSKRFRGKDKELKIGAMAPCLFHYGSPANSVPYFGRSGLNAGIMLMNLTRMRRSQWTNKIRMVTTMFQNKIKLADQDILNIYFHFFPEELHVLSCDWNFRPFQCREGSYCEDPEMSQGISALHGNALSFTPQGPESLFHTVYKAYHGVKLDEAFDLSAFVTRLENSLLKAEEKSRNSDCKRFGGFDILVLNRLYDILEKMKT